MGEGSAKIVNFTYHSCCVNVRYTMKVLFCREEVGLKIATSLSITYHVNVLLPQHIVLYRKGGGGVQFSILLHSTYFVNVLRIIKVLSCREGVGSNVSVYNCSGRLVNLISMNAIVPKGLVDLRAMNL